MVGEFVRVWKEVGDLLMEATSERGARGGSVVVRRGTSVPLVTMS